jgi:hypothetical protein
MAEAMVTMTGPTSGHLQIDGNTYKPAPGGVFTIPLRLVAVALSMGLTWTGSGAPTTTDIPNGSSKVWKNTSDGTVKLYYNDNGTLKSVALT